MNAGNDAEVRLIVSTTLSIRSNRLYRVDCFPFVPRRMLLLYLDISLGMSSYLRPSNVILLSWEWIFCMDSSLGPQIPHYCLVRAVPIYLPRLVFSSISIDIKIHVFRIIILLYNSATRSGCGSVGRAVASDTRWPRFASSHQQLLSNH